jgi:hypothetical protein
VKGNLLFKSKYPQEFLKRRTNKKKEENTKGREKKI